MSKVGMKDLPYSRELWWWTGEMVKKKDIVKRNLVLKSIDSGYTCVCICVSMCV